MGSRGLHPHTQGCETTLDVVDISPHSTTGAHVDEQQQILVQGLDKPQQPLHIIGYLNLWQATSLLRQQVGLANEGLHSLQEGVSNYYYLLLSFTVDLYSGMASHPRGRLLPSPSARAMKLF